MTIQLCRIDQKLPDLASSCSSELSLEREGCISSPGEVANVHNHMLQINSALQITRFIIRMAHLLHTASVYSTNRGGWGGEGGQ